MTLKRAERERAIATEALAAIRAALEKAGVEFIAENGGGPGVRLKKKGAMGKHAAFTAGGERLGWRGSVSRFSRRNRNHHQVLACYT